MKSHRAKKGIRKLGKTLKRVLVFVIAFTFIFSDWPLFIPRPDVFDVEKAYAAGVPGHIAIYRAATAGESFTTANLDNDWDTSVATTSSINLNIDNTQIELKSGHYAVMYGLRFDSTGGSYRSEGQTGLLLNGSFASVGWGQGYTRRSNGDNELLISGGGIINVAIDDDPLVIRSFRTDVNTATMTRFNNASGVNILKLDDAWDYLRLSRTSTQTGPNDPVGGTFVEVQYNRQDEIDTGSFGHSTTVNPSEVTLKTVGHYLVFANTYGAIPDTSNDRSEINQKITLNGSDVEGSFTTVYMRGNTNGNDAHEGAASIGMIIETTTANEILNIEINRSDGSVAHTINSDPFGTYVDRTALTIVKLPDDANYIRLEDSATDNMNPTSLTPMGWNTEREEDSAFTHPGTAQPDSTIEVNTDGDYLFLTSSYAASVGVARAKWNQGWTKNGGTLIQYGQTGNYNRNSGANNTGNWSGIIFHDLIAGDYVSVENQQLGASGTISADNKGIQGVEIDSLFPGTATVSTTGTQETTIDIPTTNVHVGGSFSIIDDKTSRDVTSITITASGTVDFVNDLDNIRLYYDLDETAPYNCASESFSGFPNPTEIQFGTTDTDGFTAVTGTSTFTDSVTIATSSAMCIYPVVDVLTSTSDGELLDIEIDNPINDIVISKGDVLPATTVELAGTTKFIDYILTQTHYHWRNDDGSEALATSATGGVEDTVLSAIEERKTKRLRIEVSNEGSLLSPSAALRLEYGVKGLSCSDATGWTRVGLSGGDWDMSNSVNITDGNDTTNISVGLGGVTDSNTSFKVSNSGVKDLYNEVTTTTFTSTEFIEVEYSIEATQNAVDGTTYCFRVTNSGTELPVYSVYPEATFEVNLEVSATGAQVSAVDIPSTGIYVGGSFVIQDKGSGAGTHIITDVTITETGTVDAQNDIDNIELWYEYDTTAPYDCVSEVYDGGEIQFGSTDTNGFSGINGTSTFSGSLTASSTQGICFYPVVDVLSSAINGETLDIQITSPSVDIVASGDAVRPSSAVSISGITNLRDDVLTQIHYHWRNDDGSESAATSATGGVEDTPILSLGKLVEKRIRLEVSNEGATSSAALQYRLEYGRRVTTCGDISAWTDVGAGGGHWDMFNSSNLTDGNNTTNIAEGIGGVTNENTTFLSPNTGIKDTASQTTNIILSESEYVELEYSIISTSAAVDGYTYCFRATDAGIALPAYSTYPEVTISPDVTVGAGGTQTTYVDIPSTNNYFGGVFTIIEESDSRNVTGITITASGTVDIQNNIDNIKLYYDLDTTAPYDCASESFSGFPTPSETQFGSTDTDGFSIASTSAFTGSVGIATTSSMCVYVAYDVLSSANDTETLDIYIQNPASDVTVSSGAVVPFEETHISGATTLRGSVLTQTHYHWRNDDGSESAATSATGGVEDTALSAMGRDIINRLRIEVSNEGATSSASTQYRLEYGEKTAACSDITIWTDVDSIGGDFDMVDSGNVTDGNNTTNIVEGIGGVTDSNTTFKMPNSAVKDTSSQTTGIVLAETEFVELEYAISASTSVAVNTDYCFRVTDAGVANLTYSSYAEATITHDVDVTVSGTQTAFIDIPDTDIYMGGVFTITDTIKSRNVESITITASGTVDVQNDIDNIRLYYDLDSSFPYNCVSESFSGFPAPTETQFGVTDTDGFSVTNISTFTDSVGIATTSTMCVYVVTDVTVGAQNGELLDLLIDDPSLDILVDVGDILPITKVAISGTTNLRDDVLTQTHYHWRNDNGSESAATSATGGVEDTVLTNVAKNDIQRLRIEVSNEGATSSDPTALRLEYAKLTEVSCDLQGVWTDVDAVGGDFDMTDSLNVIDGNNTTNIATSTGGVTNENTIFITPNFAVKDSSSTVATTTFSESEYMEMEFSISATDASAYKATYCFRVSDSGTALVTYDAYAQLTIRENKDFTVHRDVETMPSGSSTLTIYNGTDYNLLSGSTTAFIRITNAKQSGAGHNVGSNVTQYADDVTAYILDPGNIETSITFVRFGATQTNRIAWEILEYIGPAGGDNEMLVRGQATTTYTTTGLQATSTVVSGVVDDTDVVVFINGQGNPDVGASDYNTGISTASWHATSTVAVFDRGEASNDAVVVSWAVVEFTGKNWKIQRQEHNYTASGITETETMTTVNSLERTFIHTQKRAGAAQQGLDELGDKVWLTGVGEISYELRNGATTPSLHNSVTWVIENTQTSGVPMVVTRQEGSLTNISDPEPSAYNINIGKALSDITIASIFMNHYTDGPGTAYPRTMLGARIISTTQFELWQSDTGQEQWYAVEIVEWPTAERTISQNYYRFYVDNDALDPTDPWPAGGTDLGENTSITANDSPPATGDTIRIRMTLAVSGATLPVSAKSYKLQSGSRETTCSAITIWDDIGPIGSLTTDWRGFNGTTTIDETALSVNPPTVGDLNISVSDRAGTYEEENNSAVNPFAVSAGEDVEYDWLIQHNGATDQGVYCFRMVESDGTPLDTYTYYPTITTAGYGPESRNWRWADDAENITPGIPLAAENTAPIDITFNNEIKLRTTIAETAGKAGSNIKFKLQYSTSSTFSESVYDTKEVWECTATSTWCYTDGGGVDNALIDAKILSDSDTCTGGAGNGCGTHNESATSTSSFTHISGAATEFEFTIIHAGARINTTYYFRVYDVTNNLAVPLGSGESYPSLSTEGASITLTAVGVSSGTVTEGITTDVTTTPTAIDFGGLPVGTEVEAAYRLNISTSANEGYSVYMYQRQGMQMGGEEILPISGSNASPVTWITGCPGGAISCYGYHTGDDSLSSGSTRFAVDNSYAPFTSSLDEVAYSSVPVTEEITDIIYKMEITDAQIAGQYQSSVVFIIVPVF